MGPISTDVSARLCSVQVRRMGNAVGILFIYILHRRVCGEFKYYQIKQVQKNTLKQQLALKGHTV